MGPSFEGDEEKAGANLKKHGIEFVEATTVFLDPLSITMLDPDHSRDELRYVDIGSPEKGRILTIVYPERGTNIRIISCRRATPSERRTYEEGDE
jgi:uncharacterized DUF497 family protein